MLLSPPALFQQTPADAAVPLDRAREARAAHRWPEALLHYGAALSLDPAHPEARLERALLLAWMHRHDEALADLRRFRADHPDRAEEADLLLAKVTAWARRFQASVALLAPYVAQRHRQATLDSATYQAWDGAFHASLGILADWLDSHPDDLPFRLAQGRIQGWAGLHAEARETFTAILQREPHQDEALAGLAQLDLWAGAPEAAADRLARLEPEAAAKPETALLRSRIVQRLGRTREARALAEAWLKDPDQAQEAEARLLELADAAGPWVELSAGGSETNEGLRATTQRIEAALPAWEGSLRVGGQWNALRQPYQSDQRPTEAFLGFSHPVGARGFASAGYARVGGSDLGAASNLTLSGGWTLLREPGRSLSASGTWSRQVSLATAFAARTRAWTESTGAGLDGAWGLSTGNLNLERAFVEAPSGRARRDALSLAGSRRFPWPTWEFRVGGTLRMVNHDHVLNLGFFMPERFRLAAATTGITWRREGRWEASLDAQLGAQDVNRQGSRLAWGYAANLQATPWGPRCALFLTWSESAVALPVTDATSLDHYREHALRLGLRLRGARWIW